MGGMIPDQEYHVAKKLPSREDLHSNRWVPTQLSNCNPITHPAGQKTLETIFTGRGGFYSEVQTI